MRRLTIDHRPPTLSNSNGVRRVKRVCVILLLFCAGQLHAQVAVRFIITADTTPEWNVNFETGEFAWASDMVTDKSGNIYSTGFFQKSLSMGKDTFDPGTPCYTRCPDTYFLMKCDAEGKLRWVRYGLGRARPCKIRLDSKGFIYTVGSVFDKELYWTSSDTTRIKLERPNNSSGVFICQYNESGTVLRTKFLSADTTETPNDFVLDGNNNVYVGGSYDSRAHEDRARVRKRYFLLKLDKNWEQVWKQVGDSIGQSAVTALALDKSNNLYATGYYNYCLDFGKKILNRHNDYPNQNKPNLFVARFENNGQCTWVIDSTGGTLGTGKSIVCDKNGNVYLAANTEFSKIYLSKISKDKKCLWNQTIQGTSAIDNTCLVTDDKHIYISGQGNDAMFASYEREAFSFKSKGGTDYYFAKYNSKGECIWLKTGGGTGDDHCKAISIYKKGLVAFGWVDRTFWLSKFRVP